MKVYVPVVAAGLRELEDSESLGPAPMSAFAVTPALRDWYGAADDGSPGARGCLRLLSADPTQPRRRIIVVADAPRPTGVRATSSRGRQLRKSVHSWNCSDSRPL